MVMDNNTRDKSARVDQPLDRGIGIRPSLDPERFGRLSESVARHIGSWAFIAWMTVVIIAWLIFNIVAPAGLRPDAYPFIFLTLLLSLQASYAAPLILLAQNRQTDRDRIQFAEDRARDERNLADTEYITREIASVRTALNDVATRDFIRGEIRDLLGEIKENQEKE